MTTTTAAFDADDQVTPPGARPAFLSALRHGHYPVVPEVLAVAVSALEGIDKLEQQVHQAAPEGLGTFCRRVADDVLAGRGFPEDFASAAFLAQQSADRLTATSSAVQTVRRSLGDRFAAVVTEALPELLDGLRAQLTEILTELRTVDADLGDLNVTDPQAVAAATNKQRAALLALDDLRKRYNRLRMGQRAALAASTTPVPGQTQWSVGHSWTQVFDTGLHEFAKQPALPSGMKQTERLRAIARRSDVWVPTVEELADAWDTAHAKPEPTVTKASERPRGSYFGSAA